MTVWTPTVEGDPEEGQVVDTISAGGVQQRLKYSSGLWFLPPKYDMYVYYAVTFWKPVED